MITSKWTYLKNLLVFLRKVHPLLETVVLVNGDEADVLKNEDTNWVSGTISSISD